MGYNPINGESYATKDGLNSKVETPDNGKPAEEENGHEPSSQNGHAQEPVAENGNGHASANGDEPVPNGKVRSFEGSSRKQTLIMMFASRRRTQLSVLSIHQVADPMVLSGRDPSLGIAYHRPERTKIFSNQCCVVFETVVWLILVFSIPIYVIVLHAF